MVALDVLDNKEQHIVIRAGEPAVVEASVINGRLMLEVYRMGVRSDEPIGAYDGTLRDQNRSWEDK